MKKRVFSILLAAVLALSTPVSAMAASVDDGMQLLEQEEAVADETLEEDEETPSEVEEASEEEGEVLDEGEQQEETLADDEETLPEETADETTEEAVKDKEEKEELSEDDNSSAAGHADEIVMCESEFNNGLTGQDLKYKDKKVVLVQDNIPWSRTGSVDDDSNRKVLNSIAAYDVVTTSDFSHLDIHDYAVIIFANDQGLSTYRQYDSFKDKMEQFASDGGVVVFGACDAGWAEGSLSAPLPGGVTKGQEYMYNNRIVNDQHPIVTGELTDGNKLTDSDLYNHYCSHDYFIRSSFPEGTQVILEDTSGRPTLIEYPMGNGRIIASGLTWEHAYRLNGSDSQVGPYAKKALEDLYCYAISISGIGNENLNFINDLQIGDKEHYVIVMDAETKAPVEGLDVSACPIIGDYVYPAKTDDKGRAKFSNIPRGKYKVTLSKNGYYDKVTYYDISGGDYRIFYMNSVVQGKVNFDSAILKESKQGEIDTYYDVLTTNANIKPAYNYELTLSAKWTGKEISDYVVYKDGKYAYSTDGKFTIKDGKFSNSRGDTVSFSDGRLSVRLVAKDGTRSEGTELFLYARKLSEGSLWGGDNKKQFSIGQKFSFTVPDKYPVIGNTDFSLDLKMIPFSYEVDDDEIMIVFGVKDYFENKDLKKAWKDYTDQFETVKRTKNLKKMMKAYGGKSGSLLLKKGWEPDFDCVGYAKGKFDPDTGEATELSGELCVSAEAMYKYNQQFIVGPVPVYFEIGGGLTIEDTPKIKAIKNDENRIIVDNSLKLIPKFTIGGGVGINGALSAGAEGEASLPIVICDSEWDFQKNKDRNFSNVSLAGEMKLKASLLFVFNAEHSVAKGEWQILRYYWDTKETEWFDNHALLEQEAQFDITDTGAYVLMDRQYLQEASEWYTEMLSAQSFEGNMTVLKSGAMPTMQPVIEYLGENRAIMLFQDDNAERSAANRSTLMYSVLNNGVWSEPKAVWDNGTADGAASIASGNDGTYVVWQKMNQVYDDDTSVDAMAAGSEIACAKFDDATDSFVDAKFVTSDNKLQMVPAAAVGNNPYAVYVENSSNALLGGGTNTVYATNLKTGQTTTIYSGTGYVSSLDAFVDGSNLNVGMSLDEDGDMNTLTDTEIYVYNGVLEQITDDETAQVNAQYSDGVLYWFDAEEACVKSYANGGVNVVVESNGAISQNFRILDNGSKKAIAWIGVSDNEEKKNAILAEVNLGNGWSEPIEIVSSAQQIMLFDGFIGEDSSWHFAATAYDSDGTPVLAYTDAMPYVTTSVSDMSTSSRGIDEEDYYLDILFDNGCEDRIERLNVEFRDPETGDEIYSVVSQCDVPGGSKQRVHLDVDIPLQFGEKTYDVYVYPDGEVDVSDNHGLVTFGESKIEFYVESQKIQQEDVIDISIVNGGELPFNGMLYIRENDEESGNLIQATAIKDLAAGATQVKTLKYDLTQIEFDEEPEKTYYFILEDEAKTRYVESVVLPNPFYTEEGEMETPTDLTVNTPDPVELDRFSNTQYQIKPVITPKSSSQWPILYTSSDESVASVDESGLITAVGEGRTVITVAAADTELSQEVNVVVTDAVKGKISIELEEVTKKTSSYQVLDEYKINVLDENGNVLPGDLFEFSADNEDAAFVTAEGSIKLLKPGKITISAVNKKAPETSAELQITVEDRKPGDIRLGYTLYGESYEGDSLVFTPSGLKAADLQLTAELYAENGTVIDDEKLLSGIKYSSNNAKVAKVDSKGTVTGAGGKGTAVITVSVTGTKLTRTFTIYSLESGDRAPQIVSGQNFEFNVAKDEKQSFEIQPVAGNTISSVYSYLYQKKGKSYRSVSGFYVERGTTTESGSVLCTLTAYSYAKSGQYYVSCYSGGNTYYLPVKVSVKKSVPKVSAKIDSFNVFYSDAGGKVTFTTDEEISDVYMYTVRDGKKYTGGYSLTQKNGGYYITPSSSVRSSQDYFKKYSQKYMMYVTLRGYNQQIVLKGKIPSTYSAPKIKITPSAITPAKGVSTTFNLTATITGTGYNTGCTVRSTSLGSTVSCTEVGNGQYNIVYRASVPSKKTVAKIYFGNTNWGANIPVSLTVNPYTKKNATYKIEKSIEYNPVVNYSKKVKLMSGTTPIAVSSDVYETPDGMFDVVTDPELGIYVIGNRDKSEYTEKQYSYSVPVRSYDGRVNSEFGIVVKVSAKNLTATTSAKNLTMDTSAKGHILSPDLLIDKQSISAFKQTYNYELTIKTLKVAVTKDGSASTDLYAEYQTGDFIKLFNNRVCEGNYVVSVTPVLTDGTVLNAVNYNVRAVKEKATVKVTSTGSLDARKRNTSSAKLTFAVSNNSASISNVSIDSSYAHAITISETDYKAKVPYVTLSLKYFEKIPTGKYSLPLNITLSDGSKVKTTAVVTVKSTKAKVSTAAVSLTKAAGSMRASANIRVTKPEDDVVYKVVQESATDMFEVVDEGSGNFVVKAKDGANIKAGTYTVKLSVTTANAPSNEAPLATTVKVTVK